MTGKTVTRADLCEAVYQKVGLSRTESATLVELVLKEITDCLERGETVKLSSFGSFVVRKKGQRIGRNPKTGKEVPISPRRVMVFKPSAILKQRINGRSIDTADAGQPSLVRTERSALDKAPDAFRTISEVADELDVPQHVLRFWESRFAQIKPMKRGGGRRYYRPDDVDLLRGIRHLLYGEGYTIRGVQRILREQGAHFVPVVWQEGAPQPPHGASEDEEFSTQAPAEVEVLDRRTRLARQALLAARPRSRRPADDVEARREPPLQSAPVPRVDPGDRATHGMDAPEPRPVASAADVAPPQQCGKDRKVSRRNCAKFCRARIREIARRAARTRPVPQADRRRGDAHRMRLVPWKACATAAVAAAKNSTQTARLAAFCANCSAKPQLTYLKAVSAWASYPMPRCQALADLGRR